MGVGSGIPTASISAGSGNGSIYLAGNGNLGTTNAQSLILGGTTTGDIFLSPFGGNRIGIGFSSLPLAAFDLRSSFGTIPAASISANTSLSTLIIDNSGTGSIFTASASGSPRFAITNNGKVQFSGTTPYFVTLTSSISANKEFVFPDFVGTIADICLDTGNCAGAGGGIIGNGTATRIAFYDGTQSITSDSNLYFDNINKRLGLGTDTPLSTLDVRGTSGTTSFTSISGDSSFAGLLVDNSGIGDLLTASKSGSTKFVVTNEGSIGFTGGASSLSVINSSASASRQYTFPDLNGVICLDSGNCAGAGGGVIGSGSTGRVARFLLSGTIENSSINDLYDSGVALTIASDGSVGINNSNPFATLDVRSIGNNLPVASFSGSTSTATLILNNNGDGDLISASASSNTRFRVTNTGELVIGDNNTSFFTTIDPASLTANRTIVLPDENGTLCLQGSGNCGFALGSENYWRNSSNFINLNNATYDFGVGGDATSSAKFAILNVNNARGQQVATLSGDLVLDKAASIQTTNNQTLTLGGSTTGNIVLSGFTSGALQTNASGRILSATLPSLFGGTGFTTYSQGDLLYGNGSGSLSQRTIGGEGEVLSVVSGLPQWVATSIFNFWQRNDGAVAPLNITDDLLIGGSSTQSAQFAILNTANDAPIATLSGSTDNGLSLVANSSTIQSLRNNTLTIGGDTTGNILLSPLNGGAGSELSTNAEAVNFIGTSTLNALTLTTITSSGTLGVSATQFNLGAGAPATIGTVSDDNLTLSPNGTGNLVLASDFNSSVFVGNASTPAPLSISGGIGNNSALIVNQLNSGDIITASSSGVTRFRVTNTGELVIGDNNTSFFTTIDPASLTANRTLTAPNEDGTLCLQGSLACGFALGSENYWQLNGKLVSPSNSTYDFAIGGIATTSAQFAVIGVSNDAPIATLSGSTNNGLSLDANNSTIQSLRNNTLTLGGSSTGDIILAGRNGTNNSLILSGYGPGALQADASGRITSGTLPVSLGGTGFTTYSQGDILFGNGTNTLTRRTIGNEGDVLSVISGFPQWVPTSVLNYWQRNDGAIAPLYIADDFLLGGASSTSATFAILGNSLARGNQVASLSGDLVLDKAGSLQTTKNQTLTIGGGTTGNIVLDSGTGIINTPDLTANRAVFTDASSNLVTSALSSALLNTLTDETGTGVSVFNTSPEIITSLTTTTTNFSLLDANATTINFGSDATTINQGANGGILNLGNSGAYTIQTTTGGLTLNSGSNTLTLDSSDTTLNATGLTTITSSGTLGVSATQFNLGAGAPATIGTVSDDNLTLSPNGTGNLVLASDFNSSVFVGNASTPAPLSISGGIGNNSALIVNQLNSGDIITASSSGVTRFRVTNTGELVIGDNNTSFFTTLDTAPLGDNRAIALPDDSGTICLQGSIDCGFALGAANYWRRDDNLVHLNDNIYDFAVGGASSTSATFAILGNSLARGNQIATLSGDLVLDKAGSLQTTKKQTLTIGGNTTGNILLSPLNGGVGSNLQVNSERVTFSGTTILNATNLATITSSGTLGVSATQFNLGAGAPATIGTVSDDNLTLSPNGTGNLVLASDFNSSVFVGNASTPAPLSISGGIGNNSALIVNQLNSGDIITASSSGVTRFRVTNTGELVIGDNNTSFFTTIDPASLTANRTLTAPNEDGTLCLQGSLACGFALGTNYWQLNDKLLSPLNSTYDFAIGGDSTSSAQFAVIGVSNDAPIATLSGSTNNGLSLDANNSTIQSLRNNTLTLGGNTTGDISLSAGNGSGIFNVNSATANLIGTSILNGTSLTAINGGATAINFNEFDIDASTGSITIADDGGLGKITIDGTVLDKDSLDFVAAGLVTSGAGNALSLNSGNNTIIFDSSDTTLNATGLTTITSSPNLTISPTTGAGEITLTSDFDTNVNIGSSSLTPAVLSIGGGYGGNSALIVNQLNSGDIITASSSGVTRFRVTNTGELVIGDNNTSFFTTIDPASLTANRTLTAPNEDGTLCLQGSLACGFALGTNYWQLNDKLLSPLNSTYDFAIGGDSTSSAQFAVIGVSNDAPIATLSGSTNNGLVLNANSSSIQSLRNNTLTLGGSSTGDISLSAGNGSGIFNVNSATANLIGTSILNGTSLTAINGGATAINFNEFDVDASTGSITIADDGGLGKITIDGTVLDKDSLDFVAAGLVTSGAGNALSLNSGNNTIIFDSSDTTLNATGLTTITSSPNLTISPTTGAGEITLTSDFDTNVNIGSSSLTPAVLSIGGGYGGNSALIVNQLNSGDIITASSSGVTRFRVTNTGELVIGDNNTSFFTTLDTNTLTGNQIISLPNETGTVCLQGSTDCGFALGVSDWQLNNNILSTRIITWDFALGGNSSTSATFAILGNSLARGNQVASLSGDLVLDKAGSLQTTKNQTLTIGGGTTGNIVLDSGTGIINTPDLTANRAVFTDASSNLVTSALSSALLNTLTDETGTGVSVFNTSPEIITSLTTTTTNFSLLDANATTINFGSGATTINQGANGGILNLGNSGAYTIQTTTGGLTLNSGSNTLTLDSSDTTLNATGLTTITSSPNLTISPTTGAGEITLTSDFDTNVNIGSSSLTPAVLSIGGGYGGNSALIVNQLNSGDIITASSSGVTRFRVTNTGELVIGDNNTSFFTTIDPASLTANRTLTAPNEDGTLCLQGSLACGFALGTNYWQLNDKLLSPLNSTYDFAIGGDSTSSAQFAVIGVSNDAPIATLSGSTNNGLVLNANSSSIQSLRNNTLTLGGSSTGDISLSAGNGSGIFNVNSATANLIGTSILNGTSLTAINGGATAINFNEFDVDASTGSITIADDGGLGKITIDGTVLDKDSLDFVAAGLVTSGAGNALSLNSGNNTIIFDSSDTTLNATGLTTITSSGTLGVSATQFNLGAGAPATIGTVSDDNLTLSPNGTGNLVLASDFNSSVFVGNASTPAPLSISGGIGNNSALIVNQLNSGDIITASSSGVTRFRVTNTGELVIGDNNTSFFTTIDPATLSQNRTLTLPNEDGVVCLQGSIDCGFALGSANYWRLTDKLIHAANPTNDFALGGDSTSSATFAILGNSNPRGQQIATLSGDLVLDKAGSLQTTKNQTLTLGGNTTGDISLSAGNGSGIFNVNSATANLIGTSILNGTSLTAINGGATAINFNEFDVDASTGSITIADDGGLGKITIDGTVLDKDSLDFVAAGLVTSGAGNALSLNSGNNTIIFDSSDTTLNATGLTTITSSGTLGVSATQFNLGSRCSCNNRNSK